MLRDVSLASSVSIDVPAGVSRADVDHSLEHYNIGVQFQRQGRLTEAISAYQHAVSRFKLSHAFLNLGDVYGHLNQPQVRCRLLGAPSHAAGVLCVVFS